MTELRQISFDSFERSFGFPLLFSPKGNLVDRRRLEVRAAGWGGRRADGQHMPYRLADLWAAPGAHQWVPWYVLFFAFW
jgi:hypothetical protein